jgi:hypothetical protein
MGLLPPVHCLHAHLDQTGLGFAVGEGADGCDGFVSVFLGQDAGLFDAVAAVDEVAGLFLSSS